MHQKEQSALRGHQRFKSKHTMYYKDFFNDVTSYTTHKEAKRANKSQRPYRNTMWCTYFGQTNIYLSLAKG